MNARSKFLPLMAVVLVGFLTQGCVAHTVRTDRLAHDLDRQLPSTRFERQMGIGLGRLSMRLAQGISRMAVDEEDLAELDVLRGVQRFEFATYEVVGDLGGDLAVQVGLSLTGAGYQTLARFRDEGEAGWILYRMKDEALRRLVVCTLEDGELTLIHISGRLDALLTAAIQLARTERADEDDENRSEPAG